MKSMGRLRALSFAIAAVILGSGLAGGLSAQEKKTKEEKREEANSRSVQGLVTGMDENPVSGAVVQIKDTRTLQVRSYITQDDGTYHFYGLKSDVNYQISARSGDLAAGPKTLSIFDTRKEAILNFKLEKK